MTIFREKENPKSYHGSLLTIFGAPVLGLSIVAWGGTHVFWISLLK